MNRVFGFVLATAVIAYSIFTVNNLFEFRTGLTLVASEQQVAATNGTTPTRVILESPITASEEDRLLQSVNNYRVSKGLQPLVKDVRVCRSAQAKATDMHAFDYYAHTSPSGVSFDMFIGSDLPYYTAAENLALVTTDTDASLAMWQSSESHNAAMLGDYTITCIAFTRLAPTNYDGRIVSPIAVVQHFAKL